MNNHNKCGVFILTNIRKPPFNSVLSQVYMEHICKAYLIDLHRVNFMNLNVSTKKPKQTKTHIYWEERKCVEEC